MFKPFTSHFKISYGVANSDSFKLTMGVQFLIAGCLCAVVKLHWLGMVCWQVVPA